MGSRVGGRIYITLPKGGPPLHAIRKPWQERLHWLTYSGDSTKFRDLLSRDFSHRRNVCIGMIHAISGAMLYSRLVYQPEETSSSVMLTRCDCLPSALGGNEGVAGIVSSR